jgi:deoxyribonuclease-4
MARRLVSRIGAHTSTAGGVYKAAEEAVELGCNCLQIFTRSPRMWRASVPSARDVARLTDLRAEHDLNPLVVHGNYLTNLASNDREIRKNSIRSFRLEIENARAVGADYLVIHPGSAKGQTVGDAIEGLADALVKSQKGFDWGTLTLLLENTAGGGATIGRSFEELATLRAAIKQRADVPIGFCLDTAHCFEAGYDVSTAAGLRAMVREMDLHIGVENVPVIHANDSKTPLGSNRDRHESIGEGFIGAEAFERILRHPKLRRMAFILETPMGEDGTHQANVDRLRGLAPGAKN